MTKTEIIDAAFKVWGRNFYRKTSLSQLACELKVSKPALYRHFESKQALTKAMTERFLDDFSSSIRADFKKAQTQDADEGISTIISSISLFFARDVYAMIFSLINIYDRNLDSREVVQMLKAKDADMSVLQQIIEKKYTGDASITRLMFATLIFFMSHYHKKYKTIENPFSEEQIKNITSIINKTINCGLGFTAQEAAIDFENLEKMVEDTDFEKDVEPFFKAVAEAVAEAGPWDVSMEMVAKKLGLSKSSLYGHFKNKKDMLRRLFMTEFKNIMDYAKLGISKSNVTAAQLYLGIFSIAVYLRSRPEIIIAMDWIRTRRLYLGKPDKHFEIFRLFEDVNIEQLLGADEEEKQRTSHWILFQLINILT
ncbi:MAG: TetR/AcrR family transcriptional regulator, partial [Treponema sp.]|nr:TetR/AcrR family transcriptional regulator [Treponema sp.]MCL2238291.1 TetR/AcrR family transcriptional regulator [Treponema sp.]